MKSFYYQINFFPFKFFDTLFLMVKFNCINKKACLINFTVLFYFPLFSGIHFNGSIRFL